MTLIKKGLPACHFEDLIMYIDLHYSFQLGIIGVLLVREFS